MNGWWLPFRDTMKIRVSATILTCRRVLWTWGAESCYFSSKKPTYQGFYWLHWIMIVDVRILPAPVAPAIPHDQCCCFFFTGPLHLSNSHTFNHGVTDIFRYSHGDLQKFENPTTIWNMDRMLALWPYGGVAHMGPLLWPQIWVSVDEWMNVAPFLYLPVWVVISGIDEYRRCRWCDLSLKSGWKNHTFSGIVHMFSGPYAVCSKSNHCDQSTRVP